MSTYVDGKSGNITSGWDKNWTQAKNGGSPRLAIVGDSVARGYYSSGLQSKGWASLVRARLHDLYDAGFLNLWGLYRNSWAYAKTLMYWGTNSTGVSGSDSVHPSDIGHQLIANEVLNLLI